MINPLDTSLTLHKLQEEFHESFPYLKLEFLGLEKTKEGKRAVLDFQKSLKEYQISASGRIDITNELTVAELENSFKRLFGLQAQVFRRSGKLWLETTATDSWTLKYQNEQGQELTTNTWSDNQEYDYHEQE